MMKYIEQRINTLKNINGELWEIHRTTYNKKLRNETLHQIDVNSEIIRILEGK